MSIRRVVITGVGALTPVGHNVAETWASLLAGRGGVAPLTHFDVTNFDTKIAAELKDFEVTDHLDKRLARRTDPFIHYALVATGEALRQSGLTIDDTNAERVGVVFGTGIGGLRSWDTNFHTMLDSGPGRVSPFLIPMLIGNMAAGFVSIEFGAKGPSKSVQTACATSSNCIGDAMRMVQYGEADVVIAGGAEAAIWPLACAGFISMKAFSTRNDEPERASRPFDLERDGFIMGEGAGALILEERDHAIARGADILAEIVGYGQSTDAYHMAAPMPDGAGAVRAIRQALNEAKASPADVDYINAHATSTKAGDIAECAALATVFANGDRRPKPAISATKSMTGHLLGAAGAVELIVCVMSIRDQVIHPTINYEYPDPECDVDCVPNEAREATVKVAVSNSFGFGGHNCTLVVQAP